MTIGEMQGRIGYLRKEWETLWTSKPGRDFTEAEADNLKNWNVEMSDLGEKVKQAQELEEMAKGYVTPGGTEIVPNGGGEPGELPAVKEFAGLVDKHFAVDVVGQAIKARIAATPDYKRFVENGNRGTWQIHLSPEEVKTLITVANIGVQNMRLPRMEPYPVERRTVADMLMPGTMDSNVLEYYEETTFTNAAAETAEGNAKPESALDWDLKTATAAKIATWIPATVEALADFSWLDSTIRNRLVFMVQRREETQILNGGGTGADLSGITNRSGLQTQAKGTDPVPDAILKGANLIRVNSFYEPDGVVVHPLDMQDIRLLRTADGIYIFGSPSDPYTALRLWGMEVRETTAQTQNTGIVGAFGSAAQLFRRTGITVTASTEHSTYFVDNKVAILAEERIALAVFRPSAFCTVTGI